MKKLILLFILAIASPVGNSYAQLLNNNLLLQSDNNLLPADFIPVVFVMGQSNNAEGRAEAVRLSLTRYAIQPTNTWYFDKPDYSATDNGIFIPVTIGTDTKEPDNSASFVIYGAGSILSQKLARFLGRPVYEIMIGDGGTALEQNLTSPDWSVNSTGELFDMATQRFFTPAIADIQALHPGKRIVPLVLWHQGESDAPNGTATTNYPANFAAFYAGIKSYDPLLTNALWFITKLNYLQTAGETTINSFFDSFAAAHTGEVYLTGPHDRKVDLTTAEKGGFSPTTSDDEHTSWIGQNEKADEIFNAFVSHYNITGVDTTEITNHTAFDPATLSADYVRLQFNRSNLTIGGSNIVSAADNDLSGADWVPINNMRFKVDTDNEGALAFSSIPASVNQRVESATAVGTTYIAQAALSFSAWVKPRDGQPGSFYTFIHDIQNTASANNSRFGIGITTAGKLNCFLAIGGTLVNGTTNDVIFTNGAQAGWTHVAVTLNNTDKLMRIYVNGVLQSMDAVATGNFSALNLTSYVNATNKMNIGATKTGASTYVNFFFGMMQEVTLQPVQYSTTDIANLMSNRP